MGKIRLTALAVLPFIAACNEDNTFGLGDSRVDRFNAALSGANVRPAPTTTTATGTADISIRPPEIGSTVRTVSYTLTLTNLTSATAALRGSTGGLSSQGVAR